MFCTSSVEVYGRLQSSAAVLPSMGRPASDARQRPSVLTSRSARLLGHVPRDHELVLLEQSPAAMQAAQQSDRELRIAQKRSTHARIRGEGGPRPERIEARGRPMVRRDQPRWRKPETRVLQQGVNHRRQLIEAEGGELRLFGRFRPRGSLLRRQLVKNGLVQLAGRGGVLVRSRRLALVEDLGRRHRPEGNEPLQRRVEPLRRQSGDDREAVEVGDSVEPRRDEALLRRQRQPAEVDAGIQHGLPGLRLRWILHLRHIQPS